MSKWGTELRIQCYRNKVRINIEITKTVIIYVLICKFVVHRVHLVTMPTLSSTFMLQQHRRQTSYYPRSETYVDQFDVYAMSIGMVRYEKLPNATTKVMQSLLFFIRQCIILSHYTLFYSKCGLLYYCDHIFPT